MNDSKAINPERPRMRAATVGTFDGVHNGHRLVLETLRREAEAGNLEPVAVTFDRHPLELIAPHRAPGHLMSFGDRDKRIEAEGVRPLVIRFDESVRKQTAYEWMRRLHDDMKVRLLIVGYDNTFGSDGLSMSIADYQALGEVIGMRIVETPVRPGISSSAIRKAVAAGDVEKAGEMLGAPFTIEGRVKAGNHIGSEIGFPTANITPDPKRVLPAEGVYAAIATLPDGSQRRAGVNIGRRPTIGDLTRPIVEAHILDFNGDLYGDDISLALFKRIRGEEKFTSLEDLSARLKKDIAEVRETPLPAFVNLSRNG